MEFPVMDGIARYGNLLRHPMSRIRGRLIPVRSLLSFLTVAVLTQGLISQATFAATRTTSLSVSVTVVARCQVSPVAPAIEGNKTESDGPPVLVDCSMPVPYQIAVATSHRPGVTIVGSSKAESGTIPSHVPASTSPSYTADPELTTVTITY